MEKITTGELHQALAGFLMCLGSTLPPEIRSEIYRRTHQLAADMERGGEPTVAKLTKGLAEALVAVPNRPS